MIVGEKCTYSLCSAGLSVSQPTMFFSHNKSAPVSNYSQPNRAINREKQYNMHLTDPDNASKTVGVAG